VIKDHGIDYERSKFLEKLTNGTLSVTRTEGWLSSTIGKQLALGFVSIETLRAASAQTYGEIYTVAMLSLITEPTPLRLEAIPETLLFDLPRLTHMQTDLARIIASATVFAAVAQHVRNSGSHKLQEKVKFVDDFGDFLADCEPEAFDVELVISKLTCDIGTIELEAASRCVDISVVLLWSHSVTCF
jgi:hypothetical protein